MASLREHVAARKAQSTLSRVDEETFRQAMARTHERIAQETWHGRTPPEPELIAVVLDRLQHHGRLSEDEFKRFSLLSLELKQRLVRTMYEDGDVAYEDGDDGVETD